MYKINSPIFKISKLRLGEGDFMFPGAPIFSIFVQNQITSNEKMKKKSIQIKDYKYSEYLQSLIL